MKLENQIGEIETGYASKIPDRRESPRYETQFHIMHPDGWSEIQPGNLGIGGCYFITDKSVRMGDELIINLDPETRRDYLSVDCRVIRLTSAEGKTGVAAKFEQLPFKTERAIARWLDEQ